MVNNIADRKMFADVENFATEIGHYFHHRGNLKLSNEYYRISIEARRKIKISRILLTVMVLNSILTSTHFVDTDSASNGGFRIAAARVGA
ncbi:MULTISPECIES: hypothetical protein [Bacillus]|uniref:hypothetical protein n=1 Tax=Bacillus TaxID=1386 RepID=UPI00273C9E8B|nr:MULTISPECIES: hypothetical protein [Bacillus]MDP4526261.1 hypothetical protein [Bacillus halotolerans]MDY7433776.1 hypothetical protein [Bacillus sp. V26]